MGGRPAILIVDDEPNVVESLRDLLRFDYQVFGTSSVEEGREIFRREPVQVVLSDQRMPGATGVEFLGQCLREKPDVTRILMTGHADVRSVIDAINDGMVYRYVSKPWDPDELQTVIKEARQLHDLLSERKQLVEELSARNVELETANDELVRADRARVAFLNVASHELRTPLTIMTGVTDLALRSAAEGSEVYGKLEKIAAAGGRLRTLVEKLVSMLAAESSALQGKRETVDLCHFLRQAAGEVREFIAQRELTLSVDAPETLGSAEVDEVGLRDCIEQLLLNAIKFTPNGGRIQLEGRRDGDSLVIVIRDTGDGIEPEDLPRLFDPFFTSYDVSRHRSGEFEYGCRGLGLGLSVVKAQVEMQGGRIDVESARGEGSAFTITLPTRSDQRTG